MQSGVRLVRGIVKDVQPEKVVLSDGTEVPYGLLVWSTGVGPSLFVKSLGFPKSPEGRYLVIISSSLCTILLWTAKSPQGIPLSSLLLENAILHGSSSRDT